MIFLVYSKKIRIVKHAQLTSLILKTRPMNICATVTT